MSISNLLSSLRVDDGQDFETKWGKYVDSRAVEEKRRRLGLRNTNKYVFRVVDDVFDETTLNLLLRAYETAESRVAALGNTTLADGSYVSRQGRYDVALLQPRMQISSDALTSMKDRGVDARLRTGVRALVVPSASPAQPWHQDLETRGTEARYLTLVVALQDMPEDLDGATEFKAPAPREDGVLRGGAPDNFRPESYADVHRPRLLRNQGILFDGRIIHRGGAASRRRGPVVYMVYTEPELEENV